MAHHDLSEILRDWPYEIGQVKVRILEAEDGRLILQMRVDLGLLQMEMNGRPDGQRPEDADSWLDHYQKVIAEHDKEPGSKEKLILSSDECQQIREEAVQYYHRYICYFALDEYDGVVRDAIHNLALIDLCRDFGETEFDRSAAEQLRPNTIMMRARAEAAKSVAESDTKSAMATLNAALEEIREALAHLDFDEEMVQGSPEVQLIEAMKEALVPKLPVSQKAELAERLRAAIAVENYELAAILRNEIRMLKD